LVPGWPQLFQNRGIGGALLLLPLLVRVVGIEAAVPLLTVAQLCGNVARVVFGWTQIRWGLAGAFLCGAIPGAFAGSILFVSITEDLRTIVDPQ
jgi:hypothetical protein